VKVIGLELGPFAARCVVVGCGATGKAVVVDPGFEPEVVIGAVRHAELDPVAIVLTHAHFDHACGVGAVKRAFPAVPVMLHADDLPLYENLAGQGRLFGYPAPEAAAWDALLGDGQAVAFGEESLLVRHCPGHSPGHIVLIAERADPPLAIVGDVLFAGSVGRTDLWGGSFVQLERSIREVLYRLPDATRVIPGHGPETTIGSERAGNPFVSAPPG
jgi:glyoxylase-like metal-dependent hydrolase (beta-lactamase superfamily II)